MNLGMIKLRVKIKHSFQLLLKEKRNLATTAVFPGAMVTQDITRNLSSIAFQTEKKAKKFVNVG